MDADKVKFRGKGVSFTAAAGTTTTSDYKLTEARLLDGAYIMTSGNAFGDYITFRVVDVDNILGYGAGVVLDEFATTWYIPPSGEAEFHLPYSAEILSGLYLRIVYVSVGAAAAYFQCNYFLHKYMV
jgi:hypothetical protein